ncbi:MAG: sensor histidine kinase [Tenuifilaceae bacterium]
MEKSVILKHFSLKRILFYSLYWLFYLIVFITYRYMLLIVGLEDNHTIDLYYLRISILSNLVYLSLAIIGTHFITNILLPKLYSNNRYVLFSFIVGSIIITSPVFAYALVKLVVDPFIYEYPQHFNIAHYIATVMKFAFCLAPLLFYKTSKHLNEKELNQRQIERDKLETELKLREAELKLLKSQIHPHFLFNTLNNLYSLSIQKSKKTSEVIIKVSDLLNYIIYDCRSEKVSLDKELEFIDSYIELEKIRHDENLKLIVSITGNFQGKYIAPMILHTFIENSFKHGASKTTDNPWIDIYLNVTDECLTFKVANNKANDITNSNNSIGIGIANAKKRLELLYPHKHKLEIIETESVYSVFLEIQL